MRAVRLQVILSETDRPRLIGMTSKLDSAALVVRSGGMIGQMSRRSSLWTLSRFLEGDKQAIRESWPAFGGLRCFWAWGSKKITSKPRSLEVTEEKRRKSLPGIRELKSVPAFFIGSTHGTTLRLTEKTLQREQA